MILWKTPDGVSLDTLAEEATPADLIAAVRRGVESGTIKGAEVWRCETHRSDSSVPPSGDGWISCWYAANLLAHNPQAQMEPCRIIETTYIYYGRNEQ